MLVYFPSKSQPVQVTHRAKCYFWITAYGTLQYRQRICGKYMPTGWAALLPSKFLASAQAFGTVY